MTNRSGGKYETWRQIDYRPAVQQHEPHLLLERLPLPARIAEFGCGKGHLACSLASLGFEVTGIDINREAIEEARLLVKSRVLEDRVRLVHADALAYSNDSGFDAVLMARFLTCLPSRREWIRALDAADSVLHPSGLLDVLDFRFDQESSVYGPRYEIAARRRWRAGNFLVPARDDRPAFVAHHHTDGDLKEFDRRLARCDFREFDSLSMNGNPCRMFEYLGGMWPRSGDRPLPICGLSEPGLPAARGGTR